MASRKLVKEGLKCQRGKSRAGPCWITVPWGLACWKRRAQQARSRQQQERDADELTLHPPWPNHGVHRAPHPCGILDPHQVTPIMGFNHRVINQVLDK